MATETIRIDAKAYETLKRLSELSGMEMKAIVDEWLKSVQSCLNTFGNPERISLMTAVHRNHIVTFLAPIYTGSFKISESFSKRAQDFLERNLTEADIQKKRGLRK